MVLLYTIQHIQNQLDGATCGYFAPLHLEAKSPVAILKFDSDPLLAKGRFLMFPLLPVPLHSLTLGTHLAERQVCRIAGFSEGVTFFMPFGDCQGSIQVVDFCGLS